MKQNSPLRPSCFSIFMLVLVAFLTASTLRAEVPDLINYQGRLTDSAGVPINGNRSIAVRVYDSSNGGNLTYQEEIGSVSIRNGTYSFRFGASGNGIAGALTGSDYLSLSFNGTEESKRTRLLAVPFAMKSKESADAQALAATVAVLGSGVSSLENQASSIALELDGIGQSLEALDTQIASSGNLSAWEERIAALEGGFETLSGNFSSLSFRTEALENQIEPISSATSSFSSNISALDSQLAQSRQSIAQLQSLVAAMSEVLQLGPPALPSGYPPEGMVAVRGGRLPSTSELGPVNVGSFFIGRFEIWRAEWDRVRVWGLENGYQIESGSASGGGHPIRNVTWFEVAKWCNAKSEMEGLEPAYMVSGGLFKTGNGTSTNWPYQVVNVTRNQTASGYRLPTMAEWEWAARGGVLSQNYTYSGGNNLNEVAWNYSNSAGAAASYHPSAYPENRGTWPVGQKLANELGIFDMSGNVWEWCDDLYASAWGGVPGDPGPYRVVRGGGFADGQYQPDTWSFHLNYSMDWWNTGPTGAAMNRGFRIAYNVVDP